MINNKNNIFADKDSASAEKIQIPKRWFFSRIMCFLIALGVWIYVVNITTQDSEKTFNLIDINIDGWEELQEATNMSVVNLEESKVSVTVKGLRSDIANLTEKDFSAYIDISKLTDAGKHDLEVSVNLPSTVSLVSRYPETVTISVDENIEREMNVDIDVSEYSIDSNYKMGTPTQDVKSIKINGPSDVLNRVKSAKAFINLGTVTTSTVMRAKIVLVDKAGNSIDTTYLTMDITSVTVTIPVTMEKDVQLVCGFLPGVPPTSYAFINVTPNTVKLKGDPKILNDIDSLNVYNLDGTEVADLIVDFASVILPGGVEAIDAPSSIVIDAAPVQDTTVGGNDEVTTADPSQTTSSWVPEPAELY